MRVCKYCGIPESETRWVTAKGKPKGLLCLKCDGIRCNTRNATEATRAKLNASKRELRATELGREKNRLAAAAYYATTVGKTKSKVATAKWFKANKAKACTYAMRRHAAALLRTPTWVDSDHTLQIESMYNLAKIMEECTGKKYHVDHIVPLRGKEVSGLHVCYNLQVIESSVNLAKGNSYGG